MQNGSVMVIAGERMTRTVSTAKIAVYIVLIIKLAMVAPLCPLMMKNGRMILANAGSTSNKNNTIPTIAK